MKIISSEAKRLTEMVMDLLDFTRMQDGRMTLAVEMTDIRGEFEDTVYMYGGRLAQDGIQLVYLDNDEDIPEIPATPADAAGVPESSGQRRQAWRLGQAY